MCFSGSRKDRLTSKLFKNGFNSKGLAPSYNNFWGRLWLCMLKIAKKICVLNIVSSFLSIYSRRLVYNTIVFLIFIIAVQYYSYFMWSIQSKAICIISACSRYTRVDYYLSRLSCIYIIDLIEKLIFIFIFRVRMGEMSFYFGNFLIRCNNVHKV